MCGFLRQKRLKNSAVFARSPKKSYLCARIESDEAQEVASPRACRAVSKGRERAKERSAPPGKNRFIQINHTSHVRNRRDQRSSV